MSIPPRGASYTLFYLVIEANVALFDSVNADDDGGDGDEEGDEAADDDDDHHRQALPDGIKLFSLSLTKRSWTRQVFPAGLICRWSLP